MEVALIVSFCRARLREMLAAVFADEETLRLLLRDARGLDGVVERRRPVAVQPGVLRGPLHVPATLPGRARFPATMRRMKDQDLLAVAVATVAAFAERAAAERVVLVLDRGEASEPAMVECVPGERLEVTEDDAARAVVPAPGVEPAPLPVPVPTAVPVGARPTAVPDLEPSAVHVAREVVAAA